jgi:hypothetical protein
MSNSISKMISRCSKVGWEDWAWELEAWEVEGVVLGILEVGQDFYRTGGVQPLNQLVKTNLRKFPTPCTRKKNQPQKATTLLNNRVQFSKLKKKNGKRGCVVGDRNVGGEWSLIIGEGKERVVERK